MHEFWQGERVVVLDGSMNLRDVGGYPTADGGVVRTLSLFRSATLSDLSVDSLGVLANDLGVRTVVDLRSEQELSHGLPEFDAVGIRHVNVPIGDVGQGREAPPEGEAPPEPTEEEKARRQAFLDGTHDWAETYVEFFDKHGTDLAAAVRALAEPGALPAIVHCTAGRDRTGVTIALVLAAVGASPADIAADYALTGDLLQLHGERFLKNLTERGPRMDRGRPPSDDGTPAAPPTPPPGMEPPDPQKLLAAFTATPPAFMSRFLDTLVERHGSLDAALDSVGITADTRAALRVELVVPAP